MAVFHGSFKNDITNACIFKWGKFPYGIGNIIVFKISIKKFSTRKIRIRKITFSNIIFQKFSIYKRAITKLVI